MVAFYQENPEFDSEFSWKTGLLTNVAIAARKV